MEGLPVLVVFVEGYLEEASIFNLAILQHQDGLEVDHLSQEVFGPFPVQVDLLSLEAFGLKVLLGLVFLMGLQVFGSYSIVSLDQACSPALSLRRCLQRY